MKVPLNPQVKKNPTHFTLSPIKSGLEFYLQRLISCSVSAITGGALTSAAPLVGTSSRNWKVVALNPVRAHT